MNQRHVQLGGQLAHRRAGHDGQARDEQMLVEQHGQNFAHGQTHGAENAELQRARLNGQHPVDQETHRAQQQHHDEAHGQKPDGSSWQVAVTDPRDTEGDYLGVVSLNGTEFLSTSGDYEKYFIEDGVRYHHILDPSTGYPARSGLTSVTVVCSDGLDADGLSTACFVLGREKAKKLLEQYNADGLFVDDSGHVYLTEGMKERFQLMKDTYSVSE